MSEAAVVARPMTLDAFLSFLEARPNGERWVLDDGRPVMNPMPTLRHDWIQSNIIMTLRAVRRDRGATWRPIGPSQVPVPGLNRTVAPDVLVAPEPDRDDVSITAHPIVVFEVLSKSDTAKRRARKLADYGVITSIRHYVTIRQDRRAFTAYHRDAIGRLIEAPATERIRLDAIDVVLTLDAIYEDTPLAR